MGKALLDVRRVCDELVDQNIHDIKIQNKGKLPLILVYAIPDAEKSEKNSSGLEKRMPKKSRVSLTGSGDDRHKLKMRL